MFLKFAKASDSAAQRGRGKLREADTVGLFLRIPVQDKGFWDLLGGKAHVLTVVGIREIFFGNGRDGSRIGVKYSDDILDADILIISYVQIHIIS